MGKFGDIELTILGPLQACKGIHLRPDFLSLSPFFAYLFLNLRKKKMENPRKIHPFYSPVVVLEICDNLSLNKFFAIKILPETPTNNLFFQLVS